MDSKDGLASLEDTSVTSQLEVVSTSKNKDTENCVEEVSEENKESDQPQFDKDITEVHDETDKEETAVTCEKDSTSNIEESDSTVCLETIEGNDNAEVEIALSENDSETVTIEGSNTVESFCKEDATVHIETETTGLDTSNLDKKCETEHLLTTEDSCKALDDTVNNGTKSINDEIIIDESETLSKEKNKDCDVPDESSSNADNMQISEREASLNKQLESLDSSLDNLEKDLSEKNINSNLDNLEKDLSEKNIDSNLDNLEKDLSEKNIDSNLDNLEKNLSEKNIEPENTEFIQFSHDKHDDSQIENQSMDAEDPFGGDNLTSENVEPVETDSLVENELSFTKLYEQGDNLQDAVNARNNDCNEKLNVDSAMDPKDTDVDKVVDNIVETSSNVQTTSIASIENTSMDTDVLDTSTSEIGTGNMHSTKSSSEQDEQAKKNLEEITTIEADEEQADVLPGQDDELCIIPDSMKVIIPNKSGKTIDDDKKESALAKDSKCDETSQKSNSELEKNTSQDKSKEVITENENKEESTVKQKVTVQNIQKPTTENSILATDVINIDDESKNSEVEEITSKDICAQCGEERACKIRVKIGTESYLVCSKTCKALYKAARNKTIDIPSQGTNSKQEKRCASCLLIIEANDERNLSWETMEYCNEECLGKFQRKYGSFCKNCNGAVQAVSLGKYCVRFGCDVRQFCCSTCLEEFKKGLKVCSYCQKDISFSAEGFLAPVGEKGQFKDFCTQDCMEKYSKLNSTEPPAPEKKPCSVCREVRFFLF